MEVDIYLK
jgi:hypothetical protein